jgi:hypothetical protein
MPSIMQRLIAFNFQSQHISTTNGPRMVLYARNMLWLKIKNNKLLHYWRYCNSYELTILWNSSMGSCTNQYTTPSPKETHTHMQRGKLKIVKKLLRSHASIFRSSCSWLFALFFFLLTCFFISFSSLFFAFSLFHHLFGPSIIFLYLYSLSLLFSHFRSFLFLSLLSCCLSVSQSILPYHVIPHTSLTPLIPWEDLCLQTLPLRRVNCLQTSMDVWDSNPRWNIIVI